MIPDELVQAALDALFYRACGYDHPPNPAECAYYKGIAECALQAAFAKLPECKGLVQRLAAELQHDLDLQGIEGEHWPYRQAEVFLGAFAREFGGQK